MFSFYFPNRTTDTDCESMQTTAMTDPADPELTIWGGLGGTAEAFVSQHPEMAERIEVAASQIKELHRWVATQRDGYVNSDDEEDEEVVSANISAPEEVSHVSPVSDTASKQTGKKIMPLHPMFLPPENRELEELLADDDIPVCHARAEKQRIRGEDGLFALVEYTLRIELALYRTVKDVKEEQILQLAVCTHAKDFSIV